jgi:superfamily I DNA/RNA helicase
MYVAMTRAKKNLFISFYGLPSRFLSEIPEENVRLTGDTEKFGDVNDEADDVQENIIDF